MSAPSVDLKPPLICSCVRVSLNDIVDSTYLLSTPAIVLLPCLLLWLVPDQELLVKSWFKRLFVVVS